MSCSLALYGSPFNFRTQEEAEEEVETLGTRSSGAGRSGVTAAWGDRTFRGFPVLPSTFSAGCGAAGGAGERRPRPVPAEGAA